MKAAENTVEFVKEWIEGTYTKRQYQNYYIVKTPHAQFLMKQTEARELLAIKDTTGHIYVFDNDLSISNYGEAKIYDDAAMSNPFLVLIYENFEFSHSRVSPLSIGRTPGSNMVDNISKWKTLDRVEVQNQSLPVPLYLSLIEVGDTRYYISPMMEEAKIPNRSTLYAWAQHSVEQNHKFPNKWTLYDVAALYSNKINKVSDIKGNYLTIAGDMSNASYVNGDGWVFIPTEFDSIEELTGRSFREARRSRPNPYAYGLTGSSVNLSQLHRRFETVAENAEAVKLCLSIREEIDSSTWKDTLRAKYLAEIAEDYIAYFEADDAWLREHYEVAQAGAMEAQLRAKVSMGLAGALVYVNNEPNPSPMSQHVVYIKTPSPGVDNPKFMKVLPSPAMANRVKGIFNGDN